MKKMPKYYPISKQVYTLRKLGTVNRTPNPGPNSPRILC